MLVVDVAVAGSQVAEHVPAMRVRPADSGGLWVPLPGDHDAAEAGEIVLGGCILPEDLGTFEYWACGQSVT